MTEKILILDFGSQYTQLIARSVREANVYCEITPFNKEIEFSPALKGVILSGSPFSVNDENALFIDVKKINEKVPVLGICYGAQLIAKLYGGVVEKSDKREYGRSKLQISKEDDLLKGIKSEKIEIVFNKDWEQGMASGIVIGLREAITLKNELEKVIITVCDQPFVSSSLFEQLFEKQNKSGKHIVASAYADTIGTPALFTKKYFDALMGLTGDQGAKILLKKYSDDLATVDFPDGYIDIDTQADYENLLNGNPGT